MLPCPSEKTARYGGKFSSYFGAYDAVDIYFVYISSRPNANYFSLSYCTQTFFKCGMVFFVIVRLLAMNPVQHTNVRFIKKNIYELERYRIQTPDSVQIRETGMKVGVGLKPATSVFELKELLGTSSTGK